MLWLFWNFNRIHFIVVLFLLTCALASWLFGSKFAMQLLGFSFRITMWCRVVPPWFDCTVVISHHEKNRKHAKIQVWTRSEKRPRFRHLKRKWLYKRRGWNDCGRKTDVWHCFTTLAMFKAHIFVVLWHCMGLMFFVLLVADLTHWNLRGWLIIKH